MLSGQTFAGNPLDRSAGDKKDEALLGRVLGMATTKAILHLKETNRAGQVLCLCCNGDKDTSLYPMSIEAVVGAIGGNSVEDILQTCLVVLLGQHPDGPWMVAVEHPRASKESILTNISASIGDENEGSFRFLDGRACMLSLPRPDAAMAGQAIAFCSWHSSNVFDGSNGEATVSTECGLKRKPAVGSSNRKLYPRIDPVMICVVVSPCGRYALLGKMKRSPKNFYSCISGFIEPGESIQEAAVREVKEETGIDVEDVRIVDSQPWPIGRGGGCELMIGCSAVASHMDIAVVEEEVEDVRWFPLSSVRDMLSSSMSRTLTAEGFMVPSVPGTYAIAHHLLQHAVRTCPVDHIHTVEFPSLAVKCAMVCSVLLAFYAGGN